MNPILILTVFSMFVTPYGIVSLAESPIERAHEGVILTRDIGPIFQSTQGIEGKIWSTPTFNFQKAKKGGFT